MSVPNTQTEAISKMLSTKRDGTTATPPAPAKVNTPNIAAVQSKNLANEAKKPAELSNDMKSAADSTPTTTTATSECARIIEESEDLVSAIESVAAMYGIPSTNIIEDDTLDGIKVTGDTIIAPAIDPKGKGAAIMRSISAVLDFISQRVDEKLNDFQNGNIENGIIVDHIKNDSDPNKGTVVSRHIDPDGNEVLAYDSGLVDMANTKTAQQFVSELRESGVIPKIKTETPQSVFDPIEKPTGMQYFTDEDNIENGVEPPPSAKISEADETATDDTSDNSSSDNTPEQSTEGGSDYGASAVSDKLDNNDDTTNVAESIGESAKILDLISTFNNTRHLGHDLLTAQGFTCTKPVDFFTESAAPKASELRHMKFDNTHLMKAVKYFNEARAEQSEKQGNHLDVSKLVNSPKWNLGVKEIENQFDCHLNIHFIHLDEYPDTVTGFTNVIAENREHKPKCTISKSKGFQLNGLPISIYLVNAMLTTEAPTDQSLFGQSVVSIFLHEIFHNIMAVLRLYNTEFNAMLSTTMITASLTKSAKVRRKLITNFVNACEEMGVLKLSLPKKKLYIKKLLLISSMKQQDANSKLAASLVEEENDTSLIDAYINKHETKQAKYRKSVYGHGLEVKSILGMATGVTFLVGGNMLSLNGTLMSIGALGILGGYISFKFGRLVKADIRKDIEARENGDVRNFEEHWCDMFAAMYNLPVNLYQVHKAKVTEANMSSEQIKKLHKIQLGFVNLFNDPHPPTIERMAAAVRYAEETLNSGAKIDPAVKKYLEWIIANHKKILEVEDIDLIYSKATFDPKTAADIDLHLQNLVNQSGMEITESFVDDFLKLGNHIND